MNDWSSYVYSYGSGLIGSGAVMPIVVVATDWPLWCYAVMPFASSSVPVALIWVVERYCDG